MLSNNLFQPVYIFYINSFCSCYNKYEKLINLFFQNVIKVGTLINVFDNLATLEPKCAKCDTKIVLGVTTKYDQKDKCHVCLKCNDKLL
jgi:hypothetical protein